MDSGESEQAPAIPTGPARGWDLALSQQLLRRLVADPLALRGSKPRDRVHLPHLLPVPFRRHVERVVGADDDVVGAGNVDEMPRRARLVGQAVEVEALEQLARGARLVHLGLVADDVAVDEAPDLV